MKIFLFAAISIAIIVLIWAFDRARKRIKAVIACDFFGGLIKGYNLKGRFLFFNVYTYDLEYYLDNEDDQKNETVNTESVEHKITWFKKEPKEVRVKEIVVAKSKYYKDSVTIVDFKKRYIFLNIFTIIILGLIIWGIKMLGMF